jgi:hypothetical protein
MSAFSFLLAFDGMPSFDSEPQFSAFFSVPDLAAAGKIAKQLSEDKKDRELLLFWQQAIVAFPQWAAARVCYAESLLKQGMLDSAWSVLIASPLRLQENPKALYLMEKMAWILGYEILHGKIREYGKQSAWIEMGVAGVEMWESPEGQALCDLFLQFLSEDRMLREFLHFRQSPRQ